MISTRSATGNQSAEPSSANQTEGMDMDNLQGAGESIPFETPADEMEETMEQRYERMIEQVRRKRMEEGIEALQAELAGDMQVLRMKIPGLPIWEKRRASSPPLNQLLV
jgi:hypothetical protein